VTILSQFPIYRGNVSLIFKEKVLLPSRVSYRISRSLADSKPTRVLLKLLDSFHVLHSHGGVERAEE